MASKQISYEKQQGEGRPLVFVHGWLGSSNSWSLVDKHLDLDNPKIFVDQRCHGDSYCEEFSIKGLAKDLKKVVEKTCGKKRPVIIGHSMGGMTALQYSTMYEDYKALCLLGTCASTPEPCIKSPEYFLEQFKEMSREKWAEMITENYLGDVADKDLKKANKIELMDADEKPVTYGLKAMIGYDVRNQLQPEKALVVAGKNDGAITMGKSVELARLLECRLVKIDSGHLMLHERPEKIAEIVTGFVTKH